MKIYTKIIGIISLGIVVFFISVLIKKEYSIENKETIFSFLVPSLLLFHYLIITKLGFNNLLNSKKGKRIINFIVIFSTVLVIGLASSLWILEYYKIANLEEPIEMGQFLTEDKIEVNLQTKYVNNKIEYSLQANSEITENFQKVKVYAILFYDKKDRRVFVIENNRYTEIWDKDSTKITSLEIIGNQRMDTASYLKIDSYEFRHFLR
ncbi:hypothetical protein [Aureivirga marina]|uniref:hypothetical protein n=1 Tax=Aureivirga marina TaxID=1182451 RepID=UPI0018CB7EDA|nr:hypothetical protein [Aureivirga marina]